MHASACNGHYDVVLMLLQSAADPDTKDAAGFSPLMLAKAHSNTR